MSLILSVANISCAKHYEEAVHTDTFIYCCDSFGLDPDEIYNMYETIPIIKEKDDFVINLTDIIFDPNFTTDTALTIFNNFCMI